MTTGQKFGGPWTVEKLSVLSDYLNFYTTALKHQPFQLIYIDAFAGAGKINIGNEDEYDSDYFIVMECSNKNKGYKHAKIILTMGGCI